MTAHHRTITLPTGKTVHAAVTYLQPQAERATGEQTMRVHITCSEWIQPQWHPAVYVAGSQTTRGKFIPHAYGPGDPHGWVFEGSFERDE